MNTMELLSTGLSPVMVQIHNNQPAVYRASGDPVVSDPSMPRYQSPYTNSDGSLNGMGVAVSLVSTASAAASGWHGFKRNHGSIGYAAWWFFMGGLFPVFTPLIAVAQGYAEPEKK